MHSIRYRIDVRKRSQYIDCQVCFLDNQFFELTLCKHAERVFTLSDTFQTVVLTDLENNNTLFSNDAVVVIGE